MLTMFHYIVLAIVLSLSSSLRAGASISHHELVKRLLASFRGEPPTKEEANRLKAKRATARDFTIDRLRFADTLLELAPLLSDELYDSSMTSTTYGRWSDEEWATRLPADWSGFVDQLAVLRYPDEAQVQEKEQIVVTVKSTMAKIGYWAPKISSLMDDSGSISGLAAGLFSEEYLDSKIKDVYEGVREFSQKGFGELFEILLRQDFERIRTKVGKNREYQVDGMIKYFDAYFPDQQSKIKALEKLLDLLLPPPQKVTELFASLTREGDDVLLELKVRAFFSVTTQVGPVMQKILQSLVSHFPRALKRKVEAVKNDLPPIAPEAVNETIDRGIVLPAGYQFVDSPQGKSPTDTASDCVENCTTPVPRQRLGTGTIADVYKVWLKTPHGGTEDMVVKLKKPGLLERLEYERSVFVKVTHDPFFNQQQQEKLRNLFKTYEHAVRDELDFSKEAKLTELAAHEAAYNSESEFKLADSSHRITVIPSTLRTDVTVSPRLKGSVLALNTAPGTSLVTLVKKAKDAFAVSLKEYRANRSKSSEDAMMNALKLLRRYKDDIKLLYLHWLDTTFINGYFHGDPHMGNLFVRYLSELKDNVVFLDFGGAGILSEFQLENIALVLKALTERNNHQVGTYLNKLCDNCMGKSRRSELKDKLRSYIEGEWYELKDGRIVEEEDVADDVPKELIPPELRISWLFDELKSSHHTIDPSVDNFFRAWGIFNDLLADLFETDEQLTQEWENATQRKEKRGETLAEFKKNLSKDQVYRRISGWASGWSKATPVPDRVKSAVEFLVELSSYSDAANLSRAPEFVQGKAYCATSYYKKDTCFDLNGVPSSIREQMVRSNKCNLRTDWKEPKCDTKVFPVQCNFAGGPLHLPKVSVLFEKIDPREEDEVCAGIERHLRAEFEKKEAVRIKLEQLEKNMIAAPLFWLQGSDDTCAVKEGVARCWSRSGEFRKLGNDYAQHKKIKYLLESGQFRCFHLEDDTVACNGENFADRATPPVDLGPVHRLFQGSHTMCAIRKDRTFRCWGFGDYQFRDLQRQAVLQFDLSSYYCAVKADGTVFCRTWSSDFPIPPEMGEVRQIAATVNSVCAIKADDTPYCVGSDQIEKIPAGLKSAIFLAARSDRVCAIRKEDHRVFCWGNSATEEFSLGHAIALQFDSNRICVQLQDGTLKCQVTATSYYRDQEWKVPADLGPLPLPGEW